MFPQSRGPKIIQRERVGKDVTRESDSGDEQVPDLPCVTPFSAEELPVVQEKYRAFCYSYLQAVTVGFSNAVGKRFMEKLVFYALMCTEEQNTILTHPKHFHWTCTTRYLGSKVVCTSENPQDYVSHVNSL